MGVVACDGPVGDVLNRDKEGGQDRKDRHKHAHRHDELERAVAKVEDAIGCELEQFSKGVLGLTGITGLAFVYKAGLAEADPTAKTADETIALGQVVDGIDDFRAHDTEIA